MTTDSSPPPAGGPGPIHDVRVSEIRPGQWWLFDGEWVRVMSVVFLHPDDRVTITCELDGEPFTTREYLGYQRAAVRTENGATR